VEAADQLVEAAGALCDAVVQRCGVAVQRDEELVEAGLDQRARIFGLGELAPVGLQADVAEGAGAARELDELHQRLLERDLTAGEDDAIVFAAADILLDDAREAVEGYTAVIVHALLHDAKGARAVAVEVHSHREIAEPR